MVHDWRALGREFSVRMRRTAQGYCWLCGYANAVICGCCTTCFADLPRLAPANLRPAGASDHCLYWLAAASYQPPVDRWLQQFKFQQQPALAKYFAALIAAQALAFHKQQRMRLPQCLTSVPMPNQRWRQRGYNQAALLGREVSRMLGIPYQDCVSIQGHKGEHFTAQHRLSASARAQAMQQRFIVREADTFAHLASLEHVAVIDDVITTGNTISAVALALLEAGVGMVSGWALAYTPAEQVKG